MSLGVVFKICSDHFGSVNFPDSLGDKYFNFFKMLVFSYLSSYESFLSALSFS